MNIGISGRVHGMLLKDEQDVAKEKLSTEYVHYDPDDNGYMLTQYDSNVATEWKKGADVLPLNQVVERPTAVIKDIPFEVKKTGCCCDDNNGNIVTGSGSGAIGG